MGNFNFYNRGQSLAGIIIVLVVVGLISGGLYYYFSKQILEIPEISEKPTEKEVVAPEEITPTPPPKEELPKEEVVPEEITPEEKIEKKPAEKPIVQKCADGTPYNQCSTNKPKYCENGNLIDKCSICGCPSGQQCQTDESCKIIPICGNGICEKNEDGYSCQDDCCNTIIIEGETGCKEGCYTHINPAPEETACCRYELSTKDFVEFDSYKLQKYECRIKDNKVVKNYLFHKAFGEYSILIIPGYLDEAYSDTEINNIDQGLFDVSSYIIDKSKFYTGASLLNINFVRAQSVELNENAYFYGDFSAIGRIAQIFDELKGKISQNPRDFPLVVLLVKKGYGKWCCGYEENSKTHYIPDGEWSFNESAIESNVLHEILHWFGATDLSMYPASSETCTSEECFQAITPNVAWDLGWGDWDGDNIIEVVDPCIFDKENICEK